MKDLIQENGELVIEGGDFVIADADTQDLERIMKISKGEQVNWPLLGVGLVSSINAKKMTSAGLKAEIKESISLDGFEFLSLDVDGSEINLNAVRNT